MVPANGLTTPPHNLEAEEATIGAILIDPESLAEVSLKPDDFYLVKHRWIWQACKALEEKREPVDLLTVQEELARRGHLVEIGGPAYLTRLITLTPTAFNVHAYAALVSEFAIRRRLVSSASAVAKLAFDTGVDIETVKAASVEIVADAADEGYCDTLQPIAPAAGDLMEQVSAGQMLGDLLKTGLAPLDANIGGLDIDTLTIVAGRPGMSKTSLMLQIADLVSERGGLVAFFSKEMSTRQCLLRLACRRAHVPVQSIRNSEASDIERDFVAQWLSHFTNRQTLYIDEKKTQTTREVLAECKKLERRVGKISLVIGDHLRLFNDANPNEVQRLGIISRGFKVIAGELKTRSLVAAQLNRGPEQRQEDDREPTMADIRGSGMIEEDADNILGLYRVDYYAKTGADKTVKILNLKLRDGDVTAPTLMDFEGRWMSFERKRQ